MPADMSTDDERTLRQGDTIEWSVVSGPHKVRFGGTNGATSVAEINTILENFSPALTPGAVGDSPQKTSGALLTAKVKDDGATVGKTFIFTCGVHTSAMLSLPFKIAAQDAAQAARTFKIKGVIDGGPHWYMETSRGDVQVDTAP